MESTFQGMVAYAEAIVAANPTTHWMPKQFVNYDNPRAHYTATGPEIWDQSGGEVDVFVAGAGACAQHFF
jgi:cysteine synthase A